MSDQEQATPPKRRVQKRSGTKIVIVSLLVLTAILGVAYIFYPDTFSTILPGTDQQPFSREESPTISRDTDPRATLPKDSKETVDERDRDPLDQSTESLLPTMASIDRSGVSISGQPDATGERCDQLATTIENFFTILDTRPYMKTFRLEERSNVHFPKLIQKLVENPPVVTGETDDLFTILQNTAHFFRLLGKDNILVLKGILDREKETFEQILADFYELTAYPDCLGQRFSLTIDDDPLYHYAGFFLNTMGGRLYLFRRDSMSRMVVSYYAILIIDQANREGKNKYGIEIRTAIDNLIDEIDASSIDLRMRERYLDTMYSLKEKYQ